MLSREVPPEGSQGWGVGLRQASNRLRGKDRSGGGAVPNRGPEWGTQGRRTGRDPVGARLSARCCAGGLEDPGEDRGLGAAGGGLFRRDCLWEAELNGLLGHSVRGSLGSEGGPPRKQSSRMQGCVCGWAEAVRWALSLSSSFP